MTEIEWLDAHGRPLTAPVPSAPAGRAGTSYRADLRSPALWVELGWVLTAVLAVVAPFLQIYRLQIGQTAAQQVDGWGRFSAALNSGEGSDAHGIRFGIVICVAAGLVVAAVVLRRLRPLRPAVGRVSSACCALGAGLLAATAAVEYLDVDALFDSLRSTVSQIEPGSVGPSLHIGVGTWTTVAAAAVGLVTLVADVAVRPGTPPSPRPHDTVGPPLSPGDEAL